MKKLSVFALAVVFAVGLAGCKGGGNEVEEQEMQPVPSCDVVCQAIYDTLVAAASDEEKLEYEKNKDQYFKDCAERCDKQMDDMDKGCFAVAQNVGEIDECQRASDQAAIERENEKKFGEHAPEQPGEQPDEEQAPAEENPAEKPAEK